MSEGAANSHLQVTSLLMVPSSQPDEDAESPQTASNRLRQQQQPAQKKAETPQTASKRLLQQDGEEQQRQPAQKKAATLRQQKKSMTWHEAFEEFRLIQDQDVKLQKYDRLFQQVAAPLRGGDKKIAMEAFSNVKAIGIMDVLDERFYELCMCVRTRVKQDASSNQLLKSAEDKASEFEKHVANAQQMINTLLAGARDSNTQLASLRNDLVLSGQGRRDLERQLAAARRDGQEAQLEAEKLRGELQHALQRASDAEDQVLAEAAAWKAKYNQLEHVNGDMLSLKQGTEADNAWLKSELAQLRKELDAASRERDDARLALANAQQQRNTALQERDDARAQLANAQQQRNTARQERDDARAQLANAQQQRDAARQERDAALQERDDAHQERESLRSRLDLVNNRLAAAQPKKGAGPSVNVTFNGENVAGAAAGGRKRQPKLKFTWLDWKNKFVKLVDDNVAAGANVPGGNMTWQEVRDAVEDMPMPQGYLAGKMVAIDSVYSSVNDGNVKAVLEKLWEVERDNINAGRA